MRKDPTFKNNKKAYLEKLRKAGKKAELIYLDIEQDHEGYPSISVENAFMDGVYIVHSSGVTRPEGFTLGFDEIEMIAAYARGLKRKNTKNK